MKLRAWDIKGNKWANTGNLMLSICNTPKSLWWQFGSEIEPLNSEESSNYILELWTGLTDKNGVDVYEGDIVSICELNKIFGEIKQMKGGAFYIDHDAATLKYVHQIHCEACETDSPVFLLEVFDPYQIEVIGNIHQHPNLLTK